jgi:hypothetical protein
MFDDIPEFGEGDVYYDEKVNRFVQLRAMHDDFMLFGGFAEYYDDARTNKSSVPISYEYAKGLKKVICVDHFADHDGIGWRVKERPIEQECS